MISQLNLRFHKKLSEALKMCSGRENASVSALAERFLNNGLKMPAAVGGYFQLIADSETRVRQLYLTTCCTEGTLAEALTGLRCVYGDLKNE